jgi:hypothetical protein
MQDRYVGDAGDYAKYALLNALAGDERAPLHLGVLWYLFPDEGHNGDGRHIAYLQQPIMAQRDPETHARLKNLVTSGQRSVDARFSAPAFFPLAQPITQRWRQRPVHLSSARLTGLAGSAMDWPR